MVNVYLGMREDLLRSKSAIFTAKEIAGQPELWIKTLDCFEDHSKQINQFLKMCFNIENLEIILTGAGTSAFIGDVLEGPFQQKTGIRTRAVATTDLVTHANQYLLLDKPILLISFARSGNSPESVAAVDLANEMCGEIYHFIITCNPEGALAKKCNREIVTSRSRSRSGAIFSPIPILANPLSPLFIAKTKSRSYCCTYASLENKKTIRVSESITAFGP